MSTISQRIQDYLVLLSITDEKYLTMAYKLVKPSYFSSSITESIVNICYQYFQQFKTAPKDHFHDEISRFLKDKEQNEKEKYVDYLERINELPPPNRDYILKTVNTFVKAREFSKSAIDFVKLTEAGDFEKAEQLMMKTLKIGVQSQNIGLKYFDQTTPTYYNTDSGEEIMDLGIPAIEHRIKLKRKQLVCILGGYKGKKSWFCVHLGKHAITKGLNVLYVTHELTAEEVEMRMDMMLGGFTSKKEPQKVMIISTDCSGNITEKKEKIAHSIYELDKVKKIRGIAKKLKGELIIKKYPMGACSMAELTRYLDYLEVYEDFIPDVLINDYADIMNLSLGESHSTRDRINQTYIEHKRIADERNILVVTPSQTTREAIEKVNLSRKDFAEDIRKLANVDLVVALSQSDEMAKENRMRIHILASRSGDDRFGCIISQNIQIGQVVVDSWTPRERENQNGETVS